MGLITQLLTLPIAPVRGVVWVGEKILEEAESQYYDPAAVQAALDDVDARHRAGELTDEQAADLEEGLVQRLMAGGWHD
ncbi:gas vesicle protein GvpG [Nocardioides sp. NPDC057772]|uniref:gas vesicle protein GvpG n=1 Tax=Nocardioides sp. NPDC057772 TaxID=3346245 RepID=UPI00367303D5